MSVIRRPGAWLVPLLIGLLTAAGLSGLLWAALAPGKFGVWQSLAMASFLAAVPWTGLCVGNGVIGFVVGIASRRAPALPPADAAGLPRIAILVAVRNEDLTQVLPPLGRLLAGLAAAGAGGAFAPWILSDTTDPAAIADEYAALEAFAAGPGDASAPIRYRRRQRNDGFKAGNIMDFLDQHGGEFEFALVLDADSEMSAAAVLRLARVLLSAPHLAIVQHLTVGLPATAAFPRLFQFGMRAGMRVWAAGQDWWQGDQGPYWGHNAMLRVAAFRAHARLPRLPGGEAILSHDQVEAALLCGAGWGVRVLVDEDGSFEVNPPALPEFMRRDARWLAGNLQYRHLLRLPGLRKMGRWQLLQAMLLFTGGPLAVVFAAACAMISLQGDQVAAGPALALALAWPLALYLPKLAGYAALLGSAGDRSAYGGARRVVLGIGLEIIFSLLIDAVMAFAKTAALVRLALGRSQRWPAQNRSQRGVGWAEAAGLLWPQTLFGLLLFAALSAGSWRAALVGLPLAGGLVVAIPLAALTAAPGFGAWLARHGLAATPEERALRPAPGSGFAARLKPAKSAR